jgi:hypothetical protein
MATEEAAYRLSAVLWERLATATDPLERENLIVAIGFVDTLMAGREEPHSQAIPRAHAAIQLREQISRYRRVLRHIDKADDRDVIAQSIRELEDRLARVEERPSD